MLKIKLLSVGRSKERWLDDALAEYEKRLQGKVRFDPVWLKDDRALEAAVKKSKGVVLLDLGGKEVSSEQFTHHLYTLWEQNGSSLTFVIGGAEGLPSSLRSGSYPKFCFSKMTLTHQMVRLLLVEQIYRATEIRRGSRYHK